MKDETTDFGARVARHLREETVVWLTTVTPSGAPLPRPVGFLWDGGENVSISPTRCQDRNSGRNPEVTSNFRGNAGGSDIVVLSGTAEVDKSAPGAAADAAWVAKYVIEWERVGMTAESPRDAFSVPCRLGSAPSTDSDRSATGGQATTSRPLLCPENRHCATDLASSAAETRRR